MSTASADRRPVDPPPIVELKIFELKPTGEEDITFSMDANYFLFATLEQARQIAHPRGAPQDDTRLTVLTGTPVAGMVYLDRPSQAGYFIFPDLSVRHEGKFRLSFSLYEELKSVEDNDKSEEAAKLSSAGDAHVTHRLEVKSEPFTVFSAKKFPGLTESTTLSRTVAEQGCRVRIRRDVRMRRRDQKGEKDWEGYEEETAQARARMSQSPMPGDGNHYAYPHLATPHGSMDPIVRPRSASNASHHSLAASISRRPSLQELQQGYHSSQYGTAPHTPQHGYVPGSPYGPSPSQQYSQPPYMQQQSMMQPPPPQYQPQAYPPPVPAQSHYSYGYSPAQAPTSQVQPQYPPAPSHYDVPPQQSRMSVDYSAQPPPDYRRPSYSQAPPVSATAAQGYTPHPVHQGYQSQTAHQQSYQQPPSTQQSAYPNQPVQQSYTMDQYNNRPPVPPPEPLQPPTRATGATTPLSAARPFNGATLPPINTTLHMPQNKLEPSPTISSNPSAGLFNSSSTNQTPVDSHKRSYGNVFPHSYNTQQSQRLSGGARPSTPYGGQSSASAAGLFATAADDDVEEAGDLVVDPKMSHMQYRRADGSKIFRPIA